MFRLILAYIREYRRKRHWDKLSRQEKQLARVLGMLDKEGRPL